MNKTIISIVLGTYNRKPFLKRAINSIRANGIPVPYEIIVIDGGSTDGTLPWLINQKDIIVILQHNRSEWKGKPIERQSWGHFMNLGFKCAQGKFIAMISDDCLLVPGAIMNAYNLFEEKLKENKKIGAMAFYWRNWPEQRSFWVGLTLGGKMFVNHGLYLTKALRDVGYIDEDTFMFYHADGDVCLKMWQSGYECIDSPYSYVEHYSDANTPIRLTNIEVQRSDWEHYLSKWDGIFYDREKHNVGDWITKDFKDPNYTYKKFGKIVCLKSIIRMRWHQLLLLLSQK
jgi:glycosyltransferase involved in cell wall biosynthesis